MKLLEKLFPLLNRYAWFRKIYWTAYKLEGYDLKSKETTKSNWGYQNMQGTPGVEGEKGNTGDKGYQGEY